MISAIVPVYGKSPSLVSCLASLEFQTAEIVVVDDCSPKAFLGSGWQWWVDYPTGTHVVICRATNGGFGAACNTGAERAKGDWLLFVNSDVELLPGCVAAMMAVAGERTIVGAKLLYPDDRIQHGGVIFAENGWCDHRYRWQPRDYEPASRTEPCLVTGALLLVHRRMFEELGGFDPALRMAFEDIDLELRALEIGAKVTYCGTAEAYHIEGATRGATPEEKAARGPQWAAWEEDARALFQARWPVERLRELGVL